MLKPFPELTHLALYMISKWNDEPTVSLPNSFLDRTVPHLQSLTLFNISFPGLPKLLLSATHLIKLDLFYDLPPGFWYNPPEVMTTSLFPLTSLDCLRIHFGYPSFAPQSRCPPLLTRSILPILTTMHFEGASGYLEEILAWIDAPRLNLTSMMICPYSTP